MTVTAPRSRMTAEELFDLPDDDGRSELVEGELVPMTPTGGRHGALAVRIGRLLDEHVEAHDLGVCCGAETGFILKRDPDTVRAPDAAFVASERIPEDGLSDGYFPTAPDLAVEVVSPQDRPLDVREKIEDWLQGGTRLVWMVQRAQRTVTVYRPLGNPTELSEDASLDGEEVVLGFVCNVKELFV